MDKNDIERIKAIHARYEALCEKYGEDHNTPKLYYIKHRVALGYYTKDARYCGPVANENGWTP